MRISDWSSDVCSSDLRAYDRHQCIELAIGVTVGEEEPEHDQGGDGGLHEASDVRRPVLLMRGTQGSTETGDEVLAPDRVDVARSAVVEGHTAGVGAGHQQELEQDD